MKKLEGVSVGKVVKRILKRPLLALLRWATADVEANWQRGRSGIGVPGAYDPGAFKRRRGVRP